SCGGYGADIVLQRAYCMPYTLPSYPCIRSTLVDSPDDFERLTILERAQLLHDATLRRHGDMLDRHEESLARHEASLANHAEHMARLDTLLEQQARIMATLTEVSARLETTQQAILDLLRRGGNGH